MQGGVCARPPVSSHPVNPRTCWLAYLAAFGTASASAVVFIWSSSSVGPLAKGATLSLAATLVVYAFSFSSNNSSVYDPFWCVLPLWLGFYFKSLAPGGFWFYEPRETAVLVLTWVWAVRFFVLVPWEGWTRGLHIEDWRYAQFRAQLPAPAYWTFSLASLHMTPSLLVFAAFAPAARVVLQGTGAPPLNSLDLLAAALTAGGVLLEAVADAQLAHARRQGETCRSGLWRYSRHPNYCGECTFWSGLALFGVSSGAVRSEPLLIVGVAAMWCFFRFASVPIMDSRSCARRPDYAAIMQSTSPLLLWPPAGGMTGGLPARAGEGRKDHAS